MKLQPDRPTVANPPIHTTQILQTKSKQASTEPASEASTTGSGVQQPAQAERENNPAKPSTNPAPATQHDERDRTSEAGSKLEILTEPRSRSSVWATPRPRSSLSVTERSARVR